MRNSKSTMVELVQELEKRNESGKYDELIKRAKAGWYHDFKNPEHIVCGKIQFVSDSAKFPELNDLREQIKEGVYDEDADEEDKAEMRKDLPESMWGLLGL